MKKFYLSLLFLTNFLVFSQGASTYVLQENDASAWLTDIGILFSNDVASQPGYNIGQGVEQHLIYSSSFWFGGIGPNQELYMCAQKYLTTGTDQTPGPYSSSGDYNSTDYQQDYVSSLWVIDANTIHNHINDYADPGYVVPSAIADWPAHGDTTIGVAYELAPYVDVNNNQKYDPENGDYPEIKGCRAAYMITNDDANPHNGSGGQKMGIEMHYMIYQKSSQSNLPLTTFIDMTVFNRSNILIRDFTFSYFADGDIGNSTDDFSGADSTRNLMYSYNADNYDESSSVGPGFGTNPPAFGVVCLNDTMNSCGQFKTGGSYYQQDPSNSIDYWYIMNGSWINGAPWTDNNGNLTNYLYYDAPSVSGGYSGHAMQESPNDIRMVMSVKTSDFPPGSEVSRTYALVPAFGSDHIDAVDQLFSRVDDLQAAYSNGTYLECGLALNIDDEPKSEQTLDIYPNPSNGVFHIRGLEKDTYNVEIRNMIGQLIFSKDEVKNDSQVILPTGIESGMYNLKIVSSSLKSEVRTLVIE